MVLRTARGLSQPNMPDFVPVSGAFDLVQIGPPGEFIGVSFKELNLRKRFSLEHCRTGS